MNSFFICLQNYFDDTNVRKIKRLIRVYDLSYSEIFEKIFYATAVYYVVRSSFFFVPKEISSERFQLSASSHLKSCLDSCFVGDEKKMLNCGSLDINPLVFWRGKQLLFIDFIFIAFRTMDFHKKIHIL